MRLTVTLSLSLLLAACASSDTKPQATPPAAAAAAAPEPIGQQSVAAQIVRNTPGFDSQISAAPRCRMPAQAARVWRFASGRVLVDAQCDNGQAPLNLFWVSAADVEIADVAYAPLVRVQPGAGLQIDMAYTGSRIFCDDANCKIKEPLYAQPRCYARPEVAAGLAKAAAALAQRDPALKLQVLDCYRPVYVQQRMFSLVADPKWVAEPKPPRYGGHNRAVAIDLTVLRNGVALDMGTGFDAFDERSEFTPEGKGITPAQQANRVLLRQLMIEHGFRPYDGEWWHFSMPLDVAPLNLPL
jgi:zinc D-Ala-D-Ala dipeptidase